MAAAACGAAGALLKQPVGVVGAGGSEEGAAGAGIVGLARCGGDAARFALRQSDNTLRVVSPIVEGYG